MKITVRGKNISITEGIENKINQKLSKLDKYFLNSDEIEAKVLVRVYPRGQKNRSDDSNGSGITESGSD